MDTGTGRGPLVNGQSWWYVTRASGIAAWATLGASALLGQLQARRWTPGRSPAWFVDLHRGLAGLGCAALLLHLVALVADSFTNFDLLDLMIPMRSEISPGGVAWGIVALYLIVAVEATSLASRRLSWRAWRRIHYLGLAVFWLTTLHALLTGTDAHSPLWLVPAAIAAVGLAVLTLPRPWRGGLGPKVTARALPFRDLDSPAGSEGPAGSPHLDG